MLAALIKTGVLDERALCWRHLNLIDKHRLLLLTVYRLDRERLLLLRILLLLLHWGQLLLLRKPLLLL
jgi:hypothetical protein